MSTNYVGVEPFIGWKNNNEHFVVNDSEDVQVIDEVDIGDSTDQLFLTANEAETTDKQDGDFNLNPAIEDEKKKLNRISKEKMKIFDDQVRDYNVNTDLINVSFDHLHSKDSLLQNQQKFMGANGGKLDEMNNDVLSLRRQLELSYNEYKKRSFVIFILKNIFVFLMISLLIGILMNNKVIGPSIGTLLLVITGIVSGILILYNLYVNRGRDNTLYDKIKFFDKIESDDDTTKVA